MALRLRLIASHPLTWIMVGVLLGEVVEQLIGLYLVEAWSTGSSSVLDACGNAQNANSPPGIGGIIGGGIGGAGNKGRGTRDKKQNSPPPDPDEDFPVLTNEEDETAVGIFDSLLDTVFPFLGEDANKAKDRFKGVYRKDDFLKDSDDERRDE